MSDIKNLPPVQPEDDYGLRRQGRGWTIDPFLTKGVRENS